MCPRDRREQIEEGALIPFSLFLSSLSPSRPFLLPLTRSLAPRLRHLSDGIVRHRQGRDSHEGHRLGAGGGDDRGSEGFLPRFGFGGVGAIASACLASPY